MPNKVAVVTGGSRGIGRAIVLTLARAGYQIAFSYVRDEVAAMTLRDEVQASGIECLALQCDVSSGDSIKAFFERVEAHFQRIDLLVNNAGISPKGPNGARLNTLETDLRTWGQVFHVNFFSSVILARGLMQELAAAKGSVVNVTSIAGSRVHPFAGAAYSTSKAALAALTREMAHDFGPHGVRVNAIAPGEIETSILSAGTELIVDQQIPMHRLGKPEEVASLVHFLCTRGASYINGSEIHVNGGQHV